MALFESYERRIDKINSVLNSYGIASIEEAEKITKDAGLNVYDQVKKIQPICFENACWAYTVGAAIAIKKAAVRPLMLPQPSERASRPSVSPALLPIRERLALATETLARCS